MKFTITITESKIERDIGSNKNIKSSIDSYVPITMHKDLVSIMKKWKVITKSPYSDSFYDITNKSWEDSFDQPFYRVADHWNFTTQQDDKVHCATNKPVSNNKEWVLAKFDPKTNVYNVVKTFPFLRGLLQAHHTSDGYKPEKAEDIFRFLPVQIPMSQNQITKKFGDSRKELIYLVQSGRVVMIPAEMYNNTHGSTYPVGSTLVFREK
jgi:hypothetical protein